MYLFEINNKGGIYENLQKSQRKKIFNYHYNHDDRSFNRHFTDDYWR